MAQADGPLTQNDDIHSVKLLGTNWLVHVAYTTNELAALHLMAGSSETLHLPQLHLYGLLYMLFVQQHYVLNTHSFYSRKTKYINIVISIALISCWIAMQRRKKCGWISFIYKIYNDILWILSLILYCGLKHACGKDIIKYFCAHRVIGLMVSANTGSDDIKLTPALIDSWL